VNTVPVVEVCANCGAPLDLDEASSCRWCHARVRLQRATALAPLFSDQLALVPDEVDGCASAAPFLYLALSSLEMLGVQPAVKEYMGQEPWLLEQIRALSTAVSAAGVRVRDGGLLKDSFDVSLGVYTPEEIWTFDLAFDVIAWVGTLDGLTGDVRALGVDNVRSLAWYSDMHHWKRAMKKAGAGPATWHELRARMPHRGHPGKRLLEVAPSSPT
jgi:hypothetical protein